MPLNNFENSDSKWLVKLEKIVLEHLSSGQITNSWLAHQLSISERKLYRDVLKLTGLSPNLYLRKIRLYRAFEMLKSGDYLKVKRVSKKLGFQKPEYFSQLFKEEFGLTPSSVLKKRNRHNNVHLTIKPADQQRKRIMIQC